MANRLTDGEVGATLRRLRGGTSQALLAQRMNDRGWEKWSQSTLWAIEKGDRPLRLLEAVDLAEVLRVEVRELYDPRDEEVLIAAREVDSELGELAAVLESLDRRSERLRAALGERQHARVGDEPYPTPDWVTALAVMTDEVALRIARRLINSGGYRSVELEPEHAVEAALATEMRYRRGKPTDG